MGPVNYHFPMAPEIEQKLLLLERISLLCGKADTIRSYTTAICNAVRPPNSKPKTLPLKHFKNEMPDFPLSSEHFDKPGAQGDTSSITNLPVHLQLMAVGWAIKRTVDMTDQMVGRLITMIEKVHRRRGNDRT